MGQKKVKLTIEATEQELSELFGAIRLGVWLEDWCAILVQTSIDSYDTHSYKWCMRVLYLLEQMEKQTGINCEWKEYAEGDWVISFFDKVIEEKSLERINEMKVKNTGLDKQDKMLNNDKDE